MHRQKNVNLTYVHWFKSCYVLQYKMFVFYNNDLMMCMHSQLLNTI